LRSSVPAAEEVGGEEDDKDKERYWARDHLEKVVRKAETRGFAAAAEACGQVRSGEKGVSATRTPAPALTAHACLFPSLARPRRTLLRNQPLPTTHTRFLYHLFTRHFPFRLFYISFAATCVQKFCSLLSCAPRVTLSRLCLTSCRSPLRPTPRLPPSAGCGVLHIDGRYTRFIGDVSNGFRLRHRRPDQPRSPS